MITPAVRVIVEETVQTVYDLDPHNPVHEAVFNRLAGGIHADPVEPPPQIGRRVAKGGCPVLVDERECLAAAGHKTYTRLTVLELGNDGVPHTERVYSRTTTLMRPVKS
jgi:hypothetical protein